MAGPIPDAARPIIAAAHQRFRAMRPEERPNLDDPRAAVGLLTGHECFALARCRYYPIPPDVIRLGCTPAERQQKQILDAVAAQLPDAVLALLETFEI